MQTLVPIMLDHVNAGRLGLPRLVDLMCAGPARVYGAVGKGRIAAGYDADFTLVDLQPHAAGSTNDVDRQRHAAGRRSTACRSPAGRSPPSCAASR